MLVFNCASIADVETLQSAEPHLRSIIMNEAVAFAGCVLQSRAFVAG